MSAPIDLPEGVATAVIAVTAIVTIVAWIVKPARRVLILAPHRIKERFEVHRLLTAGFLHGDVGHLLFNMLTLYFFAPEVVAVVGSGRFLAIYLASIVVGFLPSTLLHLNDKRYASLGASGGVAGVMFSAIVLHPSMRLALMFIPVPMPALYYALAYLAYNAYSAYRSRDGINHEAHFAGALVGLGLTYWFEPARVSRAISQLL